MSWVANVMLVVDSEDRALLPILNQWLEHDAPWNGPSVPAGATGVGFLLDLTRPEPSYWGGFKRPECEVWAGVLNHADLAAVVAKVESVPWSHPGGVQLLVMDQEESYFRLWMIRDGHMHQFSPQPPADDDWVG